MKKIVAVFCVLGMGLGLFSGCSPAAETKTNQTKAAGEVTGAATKKEENASSKPIKIGLSMAFRDQFLSALETSMVNVAKDKNIELTTFDAQEDVQKQLDHVNTFVSQGFDAIIVNLVTTDTTEGIINAAKGTPVVFVNRAPVEQYMIEGKTAFVGSDEKDSGRLQAEFLADYFKDKEDKTINYVLFMGTLGLQHTTFRTEYAKKGLEEAGFTLNKVFEDTAEFQRAIAMEKMQQFLGTGKEFDAVICNNDEMALGVIEALRAVQKTGIPVVGIDATATAIDAIIAGDLSCSVFQNAVGQGEGALDIAYKMATGEKVEMNNYVPFELVTKDNVNDYKK